MNKFYTIGLGLLWSVFLMAACDEEGELTPTGFERDWLVIPESTNGEPVDQLRYEIYRDMGVSTYYNDTIGKEERTDVLNVPYTYYEILKVYYQPGVMKPEGYFDLLGSHDGLPFVLEYFRDRIFAKFEHPEKLPAFLFVDSLWNTQQQNMKKMLSFYIGYNTVVLRVDPNFESWNEVDKESFSHRFLIGYLAAKMMAVGEWSDAFFKISTDMNPTYYYNVYSIDTVRGGDVKLLEQALFGTKFTKKEQIGFITSFYIVGTEYEAVPTKQMDLESFVDAVLTKKMSDFEVEYADCEVVKRKFRMVKERMKEFELK